MSASIESPPSLSFEERIDVPRPVPYAIYREDVESKIRSAFAVCNRVVLAGAPGCGKTEIAISYCEYLHGRSRRTYIFWIDASTLSSLLCGYRRIATSMQIRGCDDPAANFPKLVHDWMCSTETHRSWFLVVNNFDEMAVQVTINPLDSLYGRTMLEYLPSKKGCQTLFTSKVTGAADLVNTVQYTKGLSRSDHMSRSTIQVWELLPHQSLELCRSMLNYDNIQFDNDITSAMEELVEFLGHNIIGIRQAVNWIIKDAIKSEYRAPTILAIHEYIGQVTQSLSVMLDSSRDLYAAIRADRQGRDDYRIPSRAVESLAASWRLSIDRLQYTTPKALHSLLVLCSLKHRTIPACFIQNMILDEVVRNQVMKTLVNLSLIRFDGKHLLHGTIEISIMAQTIGEMWMTENIPLQLQQMKLEAFDVVASCFPDIWSMHHWQLPRQGGSDWSWRSIDCHVLHASKGLKAIKGHPGRTELLNKYLDYCMAKDMVNDLTKANHRQMPIFRAAELGDPNFYDALIVGNPTTLHNVRYLLQEKMLPSSHPLYADTEWRVRIGSAMQRAGRFDSAYTYHSAAVSDIHDHPLDLRNYRYLSEIARCYVSIEDYDEASWVLEGLRESPDANGRPWILFDKELQPECYANNFMYHLCQWLQKLDMGLDTLQESLDVRTAFGMMKNTLGPYHVQTLLCAGLALDAIPQMWFAYLKIWKSKGSEAISSIWEPDAVFFTREIIFLKLKGHFGLSHHHTMCAGFAFAAELIAETSWRKEIGDPRCEDGLDQSIDLLSELLTSDSAALFEIPDLMEQAMDLSASIDS